RELSKYRGASEQLGAVMQRPTGCGLIPPEESLETHMPGTMTAGRWEVMEPWGLSLQYRFAGRGVVGGISQAHRGGRSGVRESAQIAGSAWCCMYGATTRSGSKAAARIIQISRRIRTARRRDAASNCPRSHADRGPP